MRINSEVIDGLLAGGNAVLRRLRAIAFAEDMLLV